MELHESSTKRSEIMSKIHGQNTSIEIKCRKWLFHKGIRYRKNTKGITGTPDITIKKYKIAIFVNGCFWHGHSCIGDKLPKTNTDFWLKKIQDNMKRDSSVIAKLEKDGWLVITVWECELRKSKIDITMEIVLLAIKRRMSNYSK